MIKAALALSLITFATIQSEEAKASNAKDLIRAACASSDPVLVYDNFKTEFSWSVPTLDLNGDAQAEVFHGDFVAKLVELNGHPAVKLNLQGDFGLPDIFETMEKIVQDLESGKVKYSRINFSQEMPLKIAAFKKDLFASDDTVPEINADNIHLFKDKILEKLWTERPDFRLEELHSIFTRLETLKVPFVVAAGNFGPNYVSVFSLLPGVISVGSLNLDGSKRATSADHSLVQLWSKGSFVTQVLAHGVDVNADGLSDFPLEILSRGQPIAEKFVGLASADVVQEISAANKEWAVKLAKSEHSVANAILNVLPEGIYRVEDLTSLEGVTPGTKRLLSSSGGFAFKSSEARAPTFFFEEDSEGKIIFDPLKDGSTNQKNVISGTSFAAPAICNQAPLQYLAQL